MPAWNTNSIWIKLNNNTNNPSKWIEQGYIEFKDRYDANSSDFNWLENPKSRWYFTSKLKPGGNIYIYSFR